MCLLVLTKYYEKLLKEKIVTEKEYTDAQKEYEELCQKAFEDAKKETYMKYKDWLDSLWSGFFESKDKNKWKDTGIAEETLVHIGNRFSNPPPPETDFVLHKGMPFYLFY